MMKITRRQLRKLILDVYKPGSKADLYDKFNITGEEQEFISDLSKSEDEDFRTQGRELAWDAYEMPIASNKSFKLMQQMDDAIADFSAWISDIPHDMQRRSLFPDGASDADVYFRDVYLPRIIDGIGLRKIKSASTKVLQSNEEPHSADKLRKALGSFVRDWDDLSQDALENMGY
jgi:hypothetical protein